MGQVGGEGWKWVWRGSVVAGAASLIPAASLILAASPIPAASLRLVRPLAAFVLGKVPPSPLPCPYLPGRASLGAGLRRQRGGRGCLPGSRGPLEHGAVRREVCRRFARWGTRGVAAGWALPPSLGLVFLQREERGAGVGAWAGADPAGRRSHLGCAARGSAPRCRLGCCTMAEVAAVPTPAFLMLGLPLALIFPSLGRCPLPVRTAGMTPLFRPQGLTRGRALTRPRGTVRNSWYGVTGAAA